MNLFFAFLALSFQPPTPSATISRLVIARCTSEAIFFKAFSFSPPFAGLGIKDYYGSPISFF